MPSKKRPRLIYFPSDIMDRQSKKSFLEKFLNNKGKVVMYYMYENIKDVKSYDEILEMTYDEGRKYYYNIRQHHKVKDLIKHWDVSVYQVYKVLYPKFDLTEMDKKVNRNKSRRGNKSKENNFENSEISNVSDIENSDKFNQSLPKVNKTNPIISPNSNFSIYFGKQGTNYNGKNVANRLLAIANTLEENMKYSIKIEIVEIEE